MMKTSDRAGTMLIVVCLVAGVLFAQQNVADTNIPPLKPGFNFDPADFPSLAGCIVEGDDLDTMLLASAGLSRHLLLAIDTTYLQITIGVCQYGVAPAAEFFEPFQALSSMNPEDRLISGSTAGLYFGDESLVANGSASGDIRGEIAFRRQNIFVSIRHIADSVMNLLTIATEIDNAIMALPDYSQINDFYPSVDSLLSVETDLAPYDETGLTVVVSDPEGSSLTKSYFCPYGEVFVDSVLRYWAGPYIGSQPLRLIVSNTELLYSEEMIIFNVANP